MQKSIVASCPYIAALDVSMHQFCIFRDAVVVALINCGSSVFCGFVIFSVLGHMADVLDLPIEDVAKAGMFISAVIMKEFILTCCKIVLLF